MEWVALVAAAGAVSGLVLVIRRLDAVQTRLAALVAAEAGALGEIRGQLASIQGGIATDAGATHATLNDVRERLGALHEQSRQVADLARDIGSLQDLLRPPKLRGGVGELLLERLLEDVIPGRYERQYEFPSTRTRVDAVVKIGDRLVPIDAKFPLEMYVEATRATGDERRAKRRGFVAAVKRHVDDISSKYLVPSDGTIDLAFMYIPSESVYYELTCAADEDLDLRAYCADRAVLPVSPNTLQAFLAAVHLGLRGMAIEERAKEIQSSLLQLARDLGRLEDEHDKVGRHLDNARAAHDVEGRLVARFGASVRHASGTLPEPAQPVLPLEPR